MDSEVRSETPVEGLDNRRRESRRWFLRLIGSAGAAAALLPFLPTIADRGEKKPQVQSGNTATRVRKWAMVIDLRRCDGCQGIDQPPQCTEACIQGHYAPEPMQFVEVYEGELKGGGSQFIPTPCQQCQNAPCVNVCPVGATFATPEGVVLIDHERCIGCRICMAACPYDRRFFGWSDPPAPPESKLATYDVEHPTARKGVTHKCDFCPEMARVGKLPYCAQACPSNAIYYGDLEEDIATNGVELVKLSEFLAENQAYRQKEHLGTKPRVYYIPGHGQAVGRDPHRHGRKATQWRWQEKIAGAQTWKR